MNKNNSAMINNGSFRDPYGQVFSYQNEIYRSIYQAGSREYLKARNEGIFEDLIDKSLLLHFSEIHEFDFAPLESLYCLKHIKIPMISYPWEWSFSMLKDAALIHLEIMDRIVPKGFWLRDANAYNIQFDGSRMILIDTLSIGERIPESPWVAYGQFCSHFLAPLAISAYRDIQLLSLTKEYIEGIPLDLTRKLLPFNKKMHPGLWMHLCLHSTLQTAANNRSVPKHEGEFKSPKVSDFSLIGLIRSLRNTTNNINWSPSLKGWADYTNVRTYQDKDLLTKVSFIKEKLEKIQPKKVWDLGGNTGEFSIIAAEYGAFVTCIDADPVCVEMLYRKIKQNNLQRILPLKMNLCNPSPNLGWNNKERLSLAQRGPADLIMALALIHHLVLTANIPIPLVAQWLSELCRFLIIEYVPESDPMVHALLWTRGENHLPYSQDLFESSFEGFFNQTDRVKLENGRILYFFIKES